MPGHSLSGQGERPDASVREIGTAGPTAYVLHDGDALHLREHFPRGVGGYGNIVDLGQVALEGDVVDQRLLNVAPAYLFIEILGNGPEDAPVRKTGFFLCS